VSYKSHLIAARRFKQNDITIFQAHATANNPARKAVLVSALNRDDLTDSDTFN
jgi:hypothetical protein